MDEKQTDKLNQKELINYRQGKISTLFRKMLFPTLIAMFFNMSLTVIDGIFVGQGVGAHGLAAVNIVCPMYMLITGIAMMFSVGASVIASIRLSKEETQSASLVMTQAFIGGALIVGILCLCMTIYTRPIVEFMGATPRIIDDSMSYMLWMQPGIFLLSIQYVGMMLIRLDGSPRYAMWIQVISAIINIILDWVLIFPFGLGVTGAAIATSFSCVIGGLMALVYFIKYSNILHFEQLEMSTVSFKTFLRNTQYMIKIGFATMLTELAMSIMMLTGNLSFKSLLGEDGVASFAVACYLFPLVFSIGNAVAQSAQPIISYNYGANQPERVKSMLKLALITSGIFGALISIILIVFNTPLVRMFISSEELSYLLAIEGIPIFGLCALFFSVNVTFIGYYQNIERAGISTTYTFMRGILFLIPAFILLPHILGKIGLWLAIPVAEIITTIIIFIVYIHNKKESSIQTS